MGRVENQPTGTFRYDKQRPDGTFELHVTVFKLHVLTELDEWPEMNQRRRTWLTPGEAAGAVDEPELKALILGLDG